MDIKLTFLGAAQNVTGSRYLVEANGSKVLIDCGLYQERQLKDRNWDPFDPAPDRIDAVVLTHAHLDHCGLLPKLVREGFSGKIHCTRATAEIAGIVMLDSGHIQEEDAAFKKRRHEREGRTGPHPVVPLYTKDEAEATLPHLTPTSFGRAVEVAKGITATFIEVGHILGASSVLLTVTGGGESRTILFSGDVGRWNMPILKDPAPVEQADYVVVESTYGDRVHEKQEDIPGRLEEIINRTSKAGGNIIIPSFSVERTQDLLYHLSGLLAQDRIPHLMTFVDSPMAIRVTKVFMNHPELFDDETMAMLKRGDHPCDFPGLKMTQTADESKAINHIKGSVIIIAGSGMCTGGRVKHHLVNNIERPACTVLFVGYQAVGTLGRIIVDGKDEVRILGRMFNVEAQIEQLGGFSAHADKEELKRWLSSLKNKPKKVFVTHGEPEAAEAFSKQLSEEMDFDTTVPAYKDSVTLD